MSYTGEGKVADDQRVWDGSKWVLAKRPLTQAQTLSATGSWDGLADYILVTGTGSRVITLPKPTIVPKHVTVIDAAGNSSTHLITVVAAGGGTIGGQSSVLLNVDQSAIDLVFTSTAGAGTWSNASRNVAAGTQRGRQIDGGTGLPVDLTGAEQGENVRYDTEVNDTTATGSVSSYVITNITTSLRFNPPAPVTLNSIVAPAVSGQELIIRRGGSSVHPVTFVHENVSETAANRIQTTGAANIVLSNTNDAVLARYHDSRWRIYPISLPDDAVTLPKIQNIAVGTVLGLQIDAGGSASPVPLLGSEQGENLRRATTVTDTTSSGTVATYPIASITTQVHFQLAGALTINGIEAVDGKTVEFNFDTGFAGSVTFNHENAGAGATGERIRTPGGLPLTITANSIATLTRFANRWRVVSVAKTSVLENIAPGRQLGLQVDAVGNAAAVALTGDEQGENIRFSTSHTAPGTGDLTDYVVNVDVITHIYIDPSVDLLFNSLAVPVTTGKQIRIIKLGNGDSVTVVNEAAVGTIAKRFKCIGNTVTPNIKLRHNGANVLVEYDGSRWNVVSFSLHPIPRGIGLTVDIDGLLSPRPRPRLVIEEENFLSGNGASGSIGKLGWNLLGSGTPGFVRSSRSLATSTGATLSTSAAANDRACLCLGDTETRTVLLVSEIAILQGVTHNVSDLTSKRFFFGGMGDFAQSPFVATDAIGIGFDTAVNGNLHIISRAAGVGAPVDTGVPALSATMIILTVFRNIVGTYEFYAGGALLGTASAVSVAGMNVGFRLETLTTAAKDLRISMFRFKSRTLAGVYDDDAFLEA